MLMIFLVPVCGLFFAYLINRIFPKAQFRGYDFLPFFFLPACNLITAFQKKPSFLPYGFLLFFLLVIVLTISTAIKDKNLSFVKTLHKMWGYLSLCSVIWYIGLLFMMLA